jgi:putative transposase
VHVLAKRHWQVRHQRRDVHHKTALLLLRQYDVIYLEDLQERTMRCRPEPQPDGNGGYLRHGACAKVGLTTSIQDTGWYAFRTILAYKVACVGKRVEAVPPAYTTQQCSGAGERVRKRLSVRTHVCIFCISCGLMLDRDENAAKNIQ